MPLGLTVALLVLGGVVVTGFLGYLIDHSAESEDQADSSAPDSKAAKRP